MVWTSQETFYQNYKAGLCNPQGYISICFVDDTFPQGDNYEECLKNVNVTIELLRQLGFTVHLEKSVLTPRQEITFLVSF